MKTLIPMAGLGKRFADAGYALPKPLIPVSGEPMIIQAVRSLPEASEIVFVCQQEHLKSSQIESTIRSYYPNSKFIPIDYLTEGQAATCLLAKDALEGEESLMIGACDHGLVWDSEKLKALQTDPELDALIWTFRNYEPVNRNPHMYGFVEVDSDGRALKVSCKTPLSEHPSQDHAICGAFWFRKSSDFFFYTQQMIQKGIRVNGEFYADLVLNEFITAGKKVKVFEIDRYLCWGTPDDLKTYEYWQKYFEKLSVVIPCYNEEKNIPQIVEKIKKYQSNKQLEFILVDNGSTDQSQAVLKKELVGSSIQLVTVEKNQGYGYGILQGLKQATGFYLAWTHADLQTDIHDVWKAFELRLMQKNQVLIKGRRKNRSLLDAFFTWGMQIYASLILGVKLSDINAQPKIFPRTLYQKMKNPPTDFSLDLYLLYLAQKEGYAIQELPVFFNKRLHGEAKGGGSFKTKWKLILRTLKFVLELQKRMKSL